MAGLGFRRLILSYYCFGFVLWLFCGCSQVVSLLFPGRGQGGRTEQGVVGDQEPTNGGGGREEAVGAGGQPGQRKVRTRTGMTGRIVVTAVVIVVSLLSPGQRDVQKRTGQTGHRG